MDMDHRKLHRQLRKKALDLVEADLKEKERKENYRQFDKHNKELYAKGIEWFNSGLSLNDAPNDIKNNTNFINGFNKTKRLDMINTMLYNDGKDFYLSGRSLDEANDKMKDNEFFINGYMDAEKLENSQKR